MATSKRFLLANEVFDTVHFSGNYAFCPWLKFNGHTGWWAQLVKRLDRGYECVVYASFKQVPTPWEGGDPYTELPGENGYLNAIRNLYPLR